MAKLSTSSLRRKLHVCCLNRLELFRRSAVWYFKDLSQYTSSAFKIVSVRVRRFRDPAPISEPWSALKPFPWRGSTWNPRDSAQRSSVGRMDYRRTAVFGQNPTFTESVRLGVWSKHAREKDHPDTWRSPGHRVPGGSQYQPACVCRHRPRGRQPIHRESTRQ